MKLVIAGNYKLFGFLGAIQIRDIKDSSPGNANHSNHQ